MSTCTEVGGAAVSAQCGASARARSLRRRPIAQPRAQRASARTAARIHTTPSTSRGTRIAGAVSLTPRTSPSDVDGAPSTGRVVRGCGDQRHADQALELRQQSAARCDDRLGRRPGARIGAPESRAGRTAPASAQERLEWTKAADKCVDAAGRDEEAVVVVGHIADDAAHRSRDQAAKAIASSRTRRHTLTPRGEAKTWSSASSGEADRPSRPRTRLLRRRRTTRTSWRRRLLAVVAPPGRRSGTPRSPTRGPGRAPAISLSPCALRSGRRREGAEVRPGQRTMAGPGRSESGSGSSRPRFLGNLQGPARRTAKGSPNGISTKQGSREKGAGARARPCDPGNHVDVADKSAYAPRRSERTGRAGRVEPRGGVRDRVVDDRRRPTGPTQEARQQRAWIPTASRDIHRRPPPSLRAPQSRSVEAAPDLLARAPEAILRNLRRRRPAGGAAQPARPFFWQRTVVFE